MQQLHRRGGIPTDSSDPNVLDSKEKYIDYRGVNNGLHPNFYNNYGSDPNNTARPRSGGVLPKAGNLYMSNIYKISIKTRASTHNTRITSL